MISTFISGGTKEIVCLKMVKVNGSVDLIETLYMLCRTYLSMCTKRFIQFDSLYKNVFRILNTRNIFMCIIEPMSL